MLMFRYNSNPQTAALRAPIRSLSKEHDKLISKRIPSFSRGHQARQDRVELKAGYDEIPDLPADSALIESALRPGGRAVTSGVLLPVCLCLRR